jgi:hypothetical protein
MSCGDSVVWHNQLFDITISKNDSLVQLVVGVWVGTVHNLSIVWIPQSDKNVRNKN